MGQTADCVDENRDEVVSSVLALEVFLTNPLTVTIRVVRLSSACTTGFYDRWGRIIQST